MSATTLEQQVPGIVSKIASFLKSKAIEIREAARMTLCKVMELLGGRFVKFMLTELSSVLSRGYQVHVLPYTIHTVLHHMATLDLINPGQLDSAIDNVIDISMTEMFGVVAEEKEVAKITGKLLEARGTKSYDTLQIVSRYISNDAILSIVKPLAKKLKDISTHKNIVKIRECYRQVVLGLLANKTLDPGHCLLAVSYTHLPLPTNREV